MLSGALGDANGFLGLMEKGGLKYVSELLLARAAILTGRFTAWYNTSLQLFLATGGTLSPVSESDLTADDEDAVPPGL